ncbi:HpcH/HpaI aldolase family protein [Kribbella kalugense]|uniref:4-hydroxy-2-oxoheptanedioate aldolase n=1 Tax=Kribbella kalugense TaxID=2512221 RepID=A0A4R7ZQ82_9ACTN|nr:aldolase/citrate lyase family protein [Kribbella kalugense]TDW18931.1 4-hydroxy-2-oxoheptanedioate aldolase [Kribbella kalugense]
MRIAPRRIRGKLESGDKAYGIAVQLPSPEIVEAVGYAGYDFAWIDAEHGAFDAGDVRDLIRAADAVGIDSLVRVANHEPIAIQHALDLGATGIIAPDVRTVTQARAIASAAHFAPTGTRGACPCGRAVGHLSEDWPSDYRRMDADVLVFGIIENPAGVDEVEAIAHEGGLDGLMFGPFDLSMSLGLDGDVAHPDIQKLHNRVVEATRSAGIEYVTPNAAWESDLEASRIIPVAGDRAALVSTFVRLLAEVQ